MSVPVGRRKESKFEAEHHFYALRDAVTELILLDFGFSEEKYLRQIERYRQTHQCSSNVNEVVDRYKRKCDAYNKWFIDREADAVLEILRDIEVSFTIGNAIYPSGSTAVMEYCERRKYIDLAIGNCYALKQELQYIVRVLPVDLNKFVRFADSIDKQIALYKGVRQSDNRFLKERKKKGNKGQKA